MMDIAANLNMVREQMRCAAETAGRKPESIRLIAVSKTKPVSMIREAVDCGVRDFGENRPQELAQKFVEVPNVRWHLIGQLQRNKVKLIIDKVFLIHSVDSLALAEEIEKRAAAIDKIQDVLIQVNISGESTKSGVSPEEAPDLCRKISLLPHIRILGLMTISVKDFSEDENRALFAKLQELAKKIEQMEIPGVFMQELSMGMTHDYTAAILAGATMVRVGSGIFGERNTKI